MTTKETSRRNTAAVGALLIGLLALMLPPAMALAAKAAPAGVKAAGAKAKAKAADPKAKPAAKPAAAKPTGKAPAAKPPAAPKRTAVPGKALPRELLVVSKLTARDRTNDSGKAIWVKWKTAKADTGKGGPVLRYVIYRARSTKGPWITVGMAQAGASKFDDTPKPKKVKAKKGRKAKVNKCLKAKKKKVKKAAVAAKKVVKKKAAKVVPNMENGTKYYFRVATIPRVGKPVFVVQTKPATPYGQLVHTHKLAKVFSAMALLVFLVLFFTYMARKGKDLYIRPIAGIDAVDEAIGRATEMGKPILYIPGIATIADVATLASLSILSRVAERAARYQSRIIVPNYDPVVFTTAQEVVKEGYMRAGRPNEFNEDDVFFLANRQFAYAAAVSGIMVREKPATNIFMGMFYAESLLLAETGASTGAIQIAGTDAVTQLPFFITACDYTLIGEELYAAGAYLGKDPKLLGSLKGQDWGKVVIVSAISLGFLFSVLAFVPFVEKIRVWFVHLFEVPLY